MLKSISIIILLLSTVHGQAQGNDSKKFQLGFSVGSNYSNLKVDSPNSFYKAQNNLGFSLGIMGEFIVKPKLSTLLFSTISFNNGFVIPADLPQFHVPNYLSTTLDIGFNLNYKFKPNAKFSPYFLLGPVYQVNLDESMFSSVFLPKNNLLLDIGFGLENKFSSFNFSPELKYSLGLINVNNDPSIRSVHLHYLQLNLRFKD